MFSEQNQQVNVRLLRDGRTRAAAFESLQGRRLHLTLPETRADGDFGEGDLVEVNTPPTIYLGQVRARVAGGLVVLVEHSIDRDALSVIHEVWHRPEGS